MFSQIKNQEGTTRYTSAGNKVCGRGISFYSSKMLKAGPTCGSGC
jgi:hypothetical protein